MGIQLQYESKTFVLMYHPEFHGLKVEEDQNDFIDDVLKITQIMGITLVEGVDLETCQLKGVVYT